MAEPSRGESVTAGLRDDQKCSMGLGVRGPPSMGLERKRGVCRPPASVDSGCSGCLAVGDGMGTCVAMVTEVAAARADDGGTCGSCGWAGGGTGDTGEGAGARMMGQGLGLQLLGADVMAAAKEVGGGVLCEEPSWWLWKGRSRSSSLSLSSSR